VQDNTPFATCTSAQVELTRVKLKRVVCHVYRNLSGIEFTALSSSVKSCHESNIVDFFVLKNLVQKRQTPRYPRSHKYTHKTIFLTMIDND
jgi:hypothetical protein